jgi:hypothetical protein
LYLKHLWLQLGDVMEMGIDGIGVARRRVVGAR